MIESDTPIDKNRVKHLLESIENDLTLGWTACQVAKQYRPLLQTNSGMDHTWLHWISYVACQREAVMTLARLTDTDAQSLSVPKLLNYSEQKPNEYKHATPEQVRKQVAKHRKWLEEHQTFIKVRGLRDKILAHTDKVKLSNPDTLVQYNVDLDQAEICLQELHHLTQIYHRFYDDSIYMIETISEDVEREMQYELELRQAAHERRRQRLEEMRNRAKLNALDEKSNGSV